MDWTYVTVTDDNDHVIKLPSMGQALTGTENDLKHVDPRESPQIQILSHILDHIMVIQHNNEQATRFLSMMTSAPLQDGSPDYKVTYMMHKTHSIPGKFTMGFCLLRIRVLFVYNSIFVAQYIDSLYSFFYSL